MATKLQKAAIIKSAVKAAVRQSHVASYLSELNRILSAPAAINDEIWSRKKQYYSDPNGMPAYSNTDIVDWFGKMKVTLQALRRFLKTFDSDSMMKSYSGKPLVDKYVQDAVRSAAVSLKQIGEYRAGLTFRRNPTSTANPTAVMNSVFGTYVGQTCIEIESAIKVLKKRAE